MTVEISLTQGKVALIDDEDMELVSKHKWCVRREPNNFYAATGVTRPSGVHTVLRMHRLIMDAPRGMDVDHINHNGLDNRRVNLRICTRTQNLRNSRKRKGCSSRFKGVAWCKPAKKWRACGYG